VAHATPVASPSDFLLAPLSFLEGNLDQIAQQAIGGRRGATVARACRTLNRRAQVGFQDAGEQQP